MKGQWGSFSIFLTILMLLMFLTPTMNGSGSWNQWRGDPLHHAIEEGPGPGKGDAIWSYQTNGQVYSSPSFYEGGMLIGSDDGNLYCFDPDTGEVKWKFRTDGEIQATAYIDDNRAYFGSFDRNLYCIDLPGLDGGIPELVWNYTTHGRIIGSCTPYLDSVIFGDNEGYIYRIDNNGMKVWENLITEDEFWASPVIDIEDKKGIIGDVGHKIIQFDLDDGHHLMTRGLGPDSEMYSSGILKDNIFYITDGEGRMLIAEDISSGELEWHFDIGFAAYSTPVIDDERIYFGSFEYMWCLPITDPDGDGIISQDEIIWSSPTHDFQGGSSPVVVGDRVYIGSDDYNLYCFDKMTGDEIWTFETKGYIYSSPVIHNGAIYLGSLDRSVYCIGDRPPGLVVEAILTPDEIKTNETAKLWINITDEDGNPVNDTTITITTSAGAVATPDGEKLGTIGLGGSWMYFNVEPFSVSSRSTMDITITSSKEGLKDGSTSLQLIVEPGGDDPSDEIEVSSTKSRTPYILGVIIVIILNLILLGILVLFKIRDINTMKEREK